MYYNNNNNNSDYKQSNNNCYNIQNNNCYNIHNNNNTSDANIEQNPQQQPQMQQATSADGAKDDNSSTGNRTLAADGATSKARARATSLIYLPPFCYTGGHVPAASSSELSPSQHSSCCWQRREYGQHKNYDKHATATTTLIAAKVAAAAEVAGRPKNKVAAATAAEVAAATMFSSLIRNASVARKFLQRDIQLAAMDGDDDADECCIDLRQASQLVMPIVVGGCCNNVLECLAVVRRQRRERMRRERQSHASTAALVVSSLATTTNSISSNSAAAAATTTTTIAARAATKNSSQTTTTALATNGAMLPQNVDVAAAEMLDNDDDEDECRCFNYNGDISALERLEQEQQQQQEQEQQQMERLEWHQLPSITWLKFWQQLANNASNSDTNATTKTTTTTTTTTTRSSGSPQPITRMPTRCGNNHSISSSSSSMTSTKSWLGPLMLTLLLATSVSGWGGRQDAPTNCTFPARWEGSWFLSGYQQSIHIKGSQFSYRGRCAASDGNKYLIVDEKGCHRCLVIYEKHKNVLQYKESECEGDSMYMHQSNPSALAMRSSIKQSDHRGGAHPNTNGHSRLSSSDQYIMRSNDDMNDCPPDFCKGRETLQNLCDQIPGDALLYSLFRESAEPVKCPLKGPFIFTYNRGHGECKSPVSNIESCTEESRLLLSFQACPDVQGTESTVEELTCLATWKDGNSRYLVGLVSHHHAISNEERYRCFVYEKISSLMGGPSMLSSKDAEYKLAQSGDATCNGLDSAEVGSRIMSLRKPPAAERCDFPAWFKGPRHWHALMGNAVYNYHSNDGSVHIIKPNGYMETRALCEQINKQTSTEMMAVVHYTTGCQSGFMCMMFYRRDTHVIEIQTGKPAIRLEDACASDHFDFNKMAYITLLASNPEPHICPMEGLYNLRGAIGPPYLVTRHKRNHNGKSHLGHGHHHHSESVGSDSGSFGHKGHSTLSFRNAERMERSSWHANTRGLPVRSRRNAPPAQQQQDQHHQEALVLGGLSSNDTSVGFIATRSRRDVPGCVTNYNSQRQLWVGCSAPNVIDVSPLCTVDGEEEYSCHGSWNENSTVYIIARHKGTKHGVCISYRPTEGNAAKLVVGDACYRGTQKPPDHHLVANLSVFGKCGETGSSASTAHLANWLLLLTMLTWLTLQS
ncbi:uncharacterized protein LOC6567544 isoform X1 [Drosophila grimshawi]|uniref:uncharacterized protein LOC6567544 isoform X1 n=1 Tax=Drosophila grimshawi TaxID=7222 RepID=UPI0013EF50EB|nr:uncharacterized protein LOC6567544 isoform X1 [Drosophila grimshawi]